DQGESDRRLTLLTRELGKIDCTAKGAKKVASRLRGVSEPLCAGRFTFAAGKKQRYVTSAQPRSAFPGLRTDFDRLNMGISWGELCSYVLPYEEPFEEAFELCSKALGELEKHPKPAVALAWSEVKLLELTGFAPSFDRCIVTGDPIKEAEAYFSCRAGGYVSRAACGDYSDRFLVRAEALYGLTALMALDNPPANLKFVNECLILLQPYWESICEHPLLARKQLLASLTSG
ncbi:MAG TPA: DNA repair protein RecO, partial [Fimbriimonas sp.]|nr:DNA repair protein RecO [Fimbriimonas sp.]